MLWIYATKIPETGLWLEFQTVADTIEDATLQIAKDLRVNGYSVDLQSIREETHIAPDDLV